MTGGPWAGAPVIRSVLLQDAAKQLQFLGQQQRIRRGVAVAADRQVAGAAEVVPVRAGIETRRNPKEERQSVRPMRDGIDVVAVDACQRLVDDLYAAIGPPDVLPLALVPAAMVGRVPRLPVSRVARARSCRHARMGGAGFQRCTVWPLVCCQYHVLSSARTRLTELAVGNLIPVAHFVPIREIPEQLRIRAFHEIPYS